MKFLEYSDKLSPTEKDFFIEHNIRATEIFDAIGLSRSDYRNIMKEKDLFFAFNTTPCSRGEHKLRDRSGHCIVCKPSNIKYQRRIFEDGYVYVAVSLNGGISKTGLCLDADAREKSLNHSYYASENDWRILFAVYSDYAGKIEDEVKKVLKIHKVLRYYYHDDKLTEAKEVFDCSTKKIINAIIENNRPKKIEFNKTKYKVNL